MLIGLATGLLMCYIHSFFEWALVTIEIQYLFALNVGLIVGLSRSLGHARPLSRPRTVDPAAMHSAAGVLGAA